MRRKKDGDISKIREKVFSMEEQLNIPHKETDVERLIEEALDLDNILNEEEDDGN